MNRRSNFGQIIALFAVGLHFLRLVPAAGAADRTWSGGGANNDWSTAANWGGTAPGNADNLIFNGISRLDNNNNVSGLTAGWLRFDSANFALSGNAFTLSPSAATVITSAAGTNTISNDLVIKEGKYWSVAVGSEVRLTGVLTNGSATSSVGWINLTNGGTLRIMNQAGSTRGMDLFQGTMIVDGGTVEARSDGVCFKPPTGSTVVVSLTNHGILRIGGGGNFRMGNNRTGLGAAAGPGSLSEVEMDSGLVELYGSATTLYLGDNVASAKAVFNQNGGLVWGSAGSGNVLAIGNVADADGTYNLNGGTLWIAQVMQANASATNVVFNFNGGTLKPTASSTTFMEGLQWAKILAGGAVIDTTNCDLTINQKLRGTGALTKLGSGTLTLGGVNPYTGGTVISNGTLAISTSALTGGGGLTVANNAGLNVAYAGSSLNAAAFILGNSGTNFLNLDLGPDGNPYYAPLVVTALTANCPVVLNLTGQNLFPGQFPLIQFASATGLNNFKLGTLPAGVTATLVPTATSLDLLVLTATGGIILGNGGFENSLSGWSTNLNSGGSATFVVTNSFKHYGKQALMVSVDSPGTGTKSVQLVHSAFAASPDDTYVLRFWAAGNEAQYAKLGVNLIGADPAYPQIPFRISTNDNNGFMEYRYAFRAAGDVQVSFSFQTLNTYYLDDVEVLDLNHPHGFDVPLTYLWQWGQWEYSKTNSNGWTGGDNNKSVALPDGSVLWLFNDSTTSALNFYSNIRGGSGGPRNAAVKQVGTNLYPLIRGGSVGNSFFPPSTNGNLYWIGDGVVESNQVKVLITDCDASLLARVGTGIATLALPDCTLAGITKVTAPGADDYNQILPGDDGYYYIYWGGAHGPHAGGSAGRQRRVAVLGRLHLANGSHAGRQECHPELALVHDAPRPGQFRIGVFPVAEFHDDSCAICDVAPRAVDRPAPSL